MHSWIDVDNSNTSDTIDERVRYQEIAGELRELVRDRAAGTLLPSESELSARFGASRVTVRRALEVVRDEGLVAARQGFGWFVATEPVRQRLEHLGTIEEQLEAGGRRAERRVTEFAFVDSPAHVEQRARRRPGAARQAAQPRRRRAVRRRHRVVPGRARPAAVARRTSSSTRSTSCSAIPLRGATQTIGADAAEPADAALLGVPVGAPLLRCQRVTTDTTGRPVLMSEHLFPAHRTEFVVELPLAEPSLTPAGLRLVE